MLRARSHLHSIGPHLSYASFIARTNVGTPLRWEPMWQYPVKITNIHVDITFIIPNLIDDTPPHAKGA